MWGYVVDGIELLEAHLNRELTDNSAINLKQGCNVLDGGGGKTGGVGKIERHNDIFL